MKGTGMKKILLLSILTTLTACGAPSVDDLIEDQELLSEILMECNTLLAQGKDTKTAKCINANKAVSQMSKNILNGIMKGK